MKLDFCFYFYRYFYFCEVFAQKMIYFYVRVYEIVLQGKSAKIKYAVRLIFVLRIQIVVISSVKFDLPYSKWNFVVKKEDKILYRNCEFQRTC